MSSIASSLALGSEYVKGDKVYKLSPCTFEIQGLFEVYLERQDLESYHRLKGRLDPEDRKLMLAAIQHKAAMRTWTFGSKDCKEALDSRPHLEYMLFLMFSKNHPEISLMDIKQWFEEDAEGMMKAAGRANADPNENREPSNPTMT